MVTRARARAAADVGPRGRALARRLVDDLQLVRVREVRADEGHLVGVDVAAPRDGLDGERRRAGQRLPELLPGAAAVGRPDDAAGRVAVHGPLQLELGGRAVRRRRRDRVEAERVDRPADADAVAGREELRDVRGELDRRRVVHRRGRRRQELLRARRVLAARLGADGHDLDLRRVRAEDAGRGAAVARGRARVVRAAEGEDAGVAVAVPPLAVALARHGDVARVVGHAVVVEVEGQRVERRLDGRRRRAVGDARRLPELALVRDAELEEALGVGVRVVDVVGDDLDLRPAQRRDAQPRLAHGHRVLDLEELDVVDREVDLGGDVLGQAEGQALVQDLGDGEDAVRAVHPDAVPGEDLAVEARPPVDVVVELVAAPEARRVRGEEERARVVVGRVVGVPVDGPQVHRDVELVVRQRRQRVQRGLDRGAVGAPVEAGRREAAVPQAEVRAGQRAPVQGQRDLLPLGHAALDDRLDADVEAREVRPGLLPVAPVLVALLEAHGPEAVARRRDELELRHVADADARVARPEVDRVEERVAVRAAARPRHLDAAAQRVEAVQRRRDVRRRRAELEAVRRLRRARVHHAQPEEVQRRVDVVRRHVRGHVEALHLGAGADHLVRLAADADERARGRRPHQRRLGRAHDRRVLLVGQQAVQPRGAVGGRAPRREAAPVAAEPEDLARVERVRQHRLQRPARAEGPVVPQRRRRAVPVDGRPDALDALLQRDVRPRDAQLADGVHLLEHVLHLVVRLLPLHGLGPRAADAERERAREGRRAGPQHRVHDLGHVALEAVAVDRDRVQVARARREREAAVRARVLGELDAPLEAAALALGGDGDVAPAARRGRGVGQPLHGDAAHGQHLLELALEPLGGLVVRDAARAERRLEVDLEGAGHALAALGRLPDRRHVHDAVRGRVLRHVQVHDVARPGRHLLVVVDEGHAPLDDAVPAVDLARDVHDAAAQRRRLEPLLDGAGALARRVPLELARAEGVVAQGREGPLRVVAADVEARQVAARHDAVDAPREGAVVRVRAAVDLRPRRHVLQVRLEGVAAALLVVPEPVGVRAGALGRVVELQAVRGLGRRDVARAPERHAVLPGVGRLRLREVARHRHVRQRPPHEGARGRLADPGERVPHLGVRRVVGQAVLEELAREADAVGRAREVVAVRPGLGGVVARRVRAPAGVLGVPHREGLHLVAAGRRGPLVGHVQERDLLAVVGRAAAPGAAVARELRRVEAAELGHVAGAVAPVLDGVALLAVAEAALAARARVAQEGHGPRVAAVVGALVDGRPRHEHVADVGHLLEDLLDARAVAAALEDAGLRVVPDRVRRVAAAHVDDVVARRVQRDAEGPAEGLRALDVLGDAARVGRERARRRVHAAVDAGDRGHVAAVLAPLLADARRPRVRPRRGLADPVARHGAVVGVDHGRVAPRRRVEGDGPDVAAHLRAAAQVGPRRHRARARHLDLGRADGREHVELVLDVLGRGVRRQHARRVAAEAELERAVELRALEVRDRRRRGARALEERGRRRQERHVAADLRRPVRDRVGVARGAVRRPRPRDVDDVAPGEQLGLEELLELGGRQRRVVRRVDHRQVVLRRAEVAEAQAVRAADLAAVARLARRVLREGERVRDALERVRRARVLVLDLDDHGALPDVRVRRRERVEAEAGRAVGDSRVRLDAHLRHVADGAQERDRPGVAAGPARLRRRDVGRPRDVDEPEGLGGAVVGLHPLEDLLEPRGLLVPADGRRVVELGLLHALVREPRREREVAVGQRAVLQRRDVADQGRRRLARRRRRHERRVAAHGLQVAGLAEERDLDLEADVRLVHPHRPGVGDREEVRGRLDRRHRAQRRRERRRRRVHGDHRRLADAVDGARLRHAGGQRGVAVERADLRVRGVGRGPGPRRGQADVRVGVGQLVAVEDRVDLHVGVRRAADADPVPDVDVVPQAPELRRVGPRDEVHDVELLRPGLALVRELDGAVGLRALPHRERVLLVEVQGPDVLGAGRRRARRVAARREGADDAGAQRICASGRARAVVGLVAAGRGDGGRHLRADDQGGHVAAQVAARELDAVLDLEDAAGRHLF